MAIDPGRCLQSVHVPVGGVRLAVDLWLPVERIAAGHPVGTVVRTTRYHRAIARPDPPAEGIPWNRAGLALVVVDARGTGASFGTRTGELSEREIADYDEIISWVARQPWSNGRVGAYGTSYEGQAAELVARLGNPHLVAVAALFSPFDPYRELFYPGGVATSGRFARWMRESRLKDGVAAPLPRVKPVDGVEGPALLEAAVAEHQANADVTELMPRLQYRDDRADALDWEATAPASWSVRTETSRIPMLIRAGWLDGAFAAGALVRFARVATSQEVEIGPWGHGGDTFADTLRLAGGDPDREGQRRGLVDFFVRHLEAGGEPSARPGSLRFTTLGESEWRTVPSWPPAGLAVRRLHLAAGGALRNTPGPTVTVRHEVDESWSSGAANRWLAIDLGRAPLYTESELHDPALLAFTSDALPADMHLLGFPVVVLRMATTGADGAVFAYLLDVGPDGRLAYLTEGCLRLLHRRTSGPVEAAGLGVARTFARSDALSVVGGEVLEAAVGLLPVSAVVRRGHRLRVALAGHDASCFARYGPSDEAFTFLLGRGCYLDLPILS